jgi:hypothetical protein
LTAPHWFRHSSRWRDDLRFARTRGTREALLTSQPVSEASIATRSRPPQIATLGWALRRAALMVAMLSAMVVVLMWLFYAGIDPDDAVAGSPTTAQSIPASR